MSDDEQLGLFWRVPGWIRDHCRVLGPTDYAGSGDSNGC